MYDCPAGCMPRRAFFDDGEEYKPKPSLCPKCQTELQRADEKVDGKKIISTDTCPKCGYVNVNELDLSPKEEKSDPDYEKDRVRFCLTKEEAEKRLREKFQLEEMGRLGKKFAEQEKRKDEYDEVKKIKKLTAIELEKLLSPILEKDGYIRLQFGTPDMDKDLFLPFTVQDSKTGRGDMESSYDLTGLIKRGLEPTNWRLMTDGVSYRVGFLTGRLRAYEREEDLLVLAQQRLKKTQVVSKV